MHEYEDGWLSIHPDKVLVGRALTATWVPGRPDIQKLIEAQGAQDHRQGAMNAWPVDMLQPRDVYVADHFGLKVDGPSIGDNVGNAIYASPAMALSTTARCAISTAWTSCRTSSPSFATTIRLITSDRCQSGKLLNSTMVSINAPTRIGQATVMPGDVVLGRNGGVIFIPPQLAERCGEVLRVDPFARYLRPPAARGEEVHRRADRCPLDAWQSRTTIARG